MRSTSCTSSVAISYYRPIGEQLSVDEINMCRLSVCVYGGLRAMQVCSSVQWWKDEVHGPHSGCCAKQHIRGLKVETFDNVSRCVNNSIVGVLCVLQTLRYCWHSACFRRSSTPICRRLQTPFRCWVRTTMQASRYRHNTIDWLIDWPLLRRWLQRRFDFDSTTIRLRYDHWTTYCGLNNQTGQRNCG